MGLFKRFNEPIFIKNSNQLNEELDYLKSLEIDDDNLKDRIKLLSYDLKSETNILSELNNSHIPMYVLHDVNLQCAGFKGIIDYIIITSHNIYIIETKNLFGSLKIDKNGNFIREPDKEIFTPYEEGNQHIELLKVIGYAKKRMIDKIIYDRLFYTYCKPVILLGNHKTMLDDTDASNFVKERVVKINHLIDYIIETDRISKNKFSNKEMFKIASSYLDNHQEEIRLYDIKYKDCFKNKKSGNEKLLKELKKYRYIISKKENKPLYMTYSDKVINEIILNKPTSINKLGKLVNKDILKKYGSKIIEIIKEND